MQQLSLLKHSVRMFSISSSAVSILTDFNLLLISPRESFFFSERSSFIELQPYIPLEPIRFNPHRAMLLIAERDGYNITCTANIKCYKTKMGQMRLELLFLSEAAFEAAAYPSSAISPNYRGWKNWTSPMSSLWGSWATTSAPTRYITYIGLTGLEPA